MKVLRDIRVSTKMLIIFELINDSKTTLKPLADKFDMTVQGVSEYLKRMQQEGLIQCLPNEYRPTKKGVQFLHDNITELRNFVIDAIKRIELIQVCSAIAKTNIKVNDKVGLFMENGVLTAYANKTSTSMGISAGNAKIGDDIAIKDLEGIVELSQGKLIIIELPSIKDGGTCNISFKKMKNILSKNKYDKLGVLDAVGLVLSKKLGLKCDFEYAANSAGIEAVQKGLDIVLIGSNEETRKLIMYIEELNTKSVERVVYKLIKI